GLTPEVRGEDAYGYRWARAYASPRRPGRPRGGQAAETPGPAGQGQRVPLNAMFEDDFVSQLVVVPDTDTVDQAAQKVAAQVVGRGGCTRVSGDGELRVTRESIERHLGRDFEMRQLEGLMSAFAGRIDMTSEEVRWRLKSGEPGRPA